LDVALTIEPKDWMLALSTRKVMEALLVDGTDARFVGGCVRDMLLRELHGSTRQVGDVDIATTATPERAMELLVAAGIKAVPTGIAHGTVTAVCDGKPFEITTLRRDVESFGRHARVAFTDNWSEDAARRDFTINAMFMAVDGRVFDPFDGLKDLATGRVRFVGEARARIEEDVLRLLRYFRFFAHFDKPPPDAEALGACRALAPELRTLSAERIHAELFKLLAAPDPVPTLKLMASEGILDHVLPEAEDIARLAALTAIERDVLKRAPDPLLRLAAVLVGGTDAALSVALRLKLSNRERARLMALSSSAPVVDGIDERSLRQLLQRLGAAEVIDQALINWAEARASNTADDGSWIKIITAAERWTPIAFPIKGDDAVKLGLKPGPLVGETIRTVEEWWAGQDFRPDRDACLIQLKAMIDRIK
jgi:poly(A) polymerase